MGTQVDSFCPNLAGGEGGTVWGVGQEGGVECLALECVLPLSYFTKVIYSFNVGSSL